MSVTPNWSPCPPGVWTQIWLGSTLFIGGTIPLWIQLSPGTPPGIRTIGWRVYSSAPPFFWAGSVTGTPRGGGRPVNTTLPPNGRLSPIAPATYAEVWVNCPVSLDVAA